MTTTAMMTAALCAGCTGEGSDSTETASSAGSASSSGNADVEPRCSEATLEGRYLYEIHGNKLFTEGLLPYLEVGQEVYDGEGGVTNMHTDSASRKDSTTKGTYTVDALCNGVVTYESGATHRMFVSPAGDEFTSFEVDSEQRGLDGGATRVAEDPSETCSAQTLTGTYSYRARGFYDKELHIEHGFETYDGAGAVTNSFGVVGQKGTQYLTGNYDVGEDCRAVVQYDEGPAFTQYLSPDGSEFLWVQIDGFSADDPGGMFGGHEHRVTTSTDPRLTVDD